MNQNKPLFKVRTAQISDALSISEMIIKSVNYFHSENYTAEGLAIWRRGYSPSEIEKQILNNRTFVLEIDGEIYGSIQSGTSEIKGLYIDPEHSNKGFGGILLQHMLVALKENGYEQIELTSNKWFVDFYKKYGFQLLGKEIVYWENKPFIEYRMIKNLTKS